MDTFRPPRYSLEENRFFLQHLGDPPVSVLQSKLPDGVSDSVVEDWEKGRLECPVDGWTTSFKIESKQSYNLARARIAKHCRSSKDERVREFALKVFS